VPLLLYGLVYPWHFMVPVALLSLSESPVAAETGLFITVLAFRAPVNVLKFLLAAMGAVFVHYGANRIFPASRLLAWWNRPRA
jgi:hypothetical protein